MYSKEELQAKSVVQLKDIAKELGVKVKSGDKKETVVYAILDAQAEQPASDAGPKRKRTRIATKKEDRVYSVHGNEGENFDVQKKHQKYVDDIASRRKSLVSTGDRSAKIRTYNFPQGRVTDHRIGYTTHDLNGFLAGDIQDMIDALTVAENAEKLKETEL